MDYDKALEIIKNKQSLGIKPGLSRIRRLLDIMGNPQNSLKIIHIAGTNGKGTVASTLAKSLEDKGFKVGLFTSPWVVDYREQIQINSHYIPKKALSDYVEKYSSCKATEFELITAIAYKYFADSGVDYAVIECGMGGENDSTNAIPTPLLSIITSISLDHTDFLGASIEDIAREKAGIIKENGTLVLYPNSKIESIFEDRCSKLKAKLIKVEDSGDFGRNNINTVKTALKALGIDTAVSKVSLPARRELIGNNIMLDGAHNPDGANALAKSLPKDREITAVIGMMRDKDVDAYLKIIAPYCKKIIATTPANPRSISSCELAKIAAQYCRDVDAIDSAEKAISVKNYDFLLICGSFYLARDVRKKLLDNIT